MVSNSFEFSTINKIYLAGSSLELREFKNAIVHYENALKSPQISEQPYSLAKTYEGLGTTFIFLKKYDKAEEYLLKNLKFKEKNKADLFHAYNNIANLYYMQYKDQLAIPYFEKSYLLSEKSNNFNKKKIASKNMAAVEENRSNYKQALVYRKEFEQWKDSLTNQNKIWAVADYEKKYAVAQKQKQISVLNIENKLKNTQRNSLFYAALGLLVLLIGGVIIYAQKVKSAKIILQQKNKLDELNATKDQLFSIVSHDLRSSVNALKTSNTKLTTSLETKNYSELDQLLHQNSAIANGTYSLLDNLLHWAMLQTKQLYFNKDSVHLHSIVQQIEFNYKSLLVDKMITFENKVSKNSFIFVDLDSLKIVLRNLLDNAIKFTPENGTINICSQEITIGFWQLSIEDDGIGMSQNTIFELLKDSELLAKKDDSERIGTGLGMQLCKQMIKKNNGTLAIESEINRGTKIIISLPKTV
ncbi:tetratricopeptide repeat-containing sensor histidine kinase [Flavobacterium cellulosilyticum]|nr:tetratricopeptide repeat-containing sensor histidine kinase [Flavobacterium cellulosilyticum]